MFDVIKKDLPNFPDEIIRDWLEPPANREKWPPDEKSIAWRGILLKRPLEFWQKVDWKKVQLNLEQIQLSPDSQETIVVMHQAYVLNEKNFFLGVFLKNISG